MLGRVSEIGEKKNEGSTRQKVEDVLKTINYGSRSGNENKKILKIYIFFCVSLICEI